jgi:hypothetical protein
MLQNKPWNKAPQLEQFQFQTSVYIGRPRKKWKGSRGSKKNVSKEGIPIHPKDFILPRFALFDFKKNAPLENYRRVCGGNFIFVTLLSNEICELLQINGLVAAVCPKKRNHRTRTSQHFATNEGEKNIANVGKFGSWDPTQNDTTEMLHGPSSSPSTSLSFFKGGPAWAKARPSRSTSAQTLSSGRISWFCGKHPLARACNSKLVSCCARRNLG